MTISSALSSSPGQAASQTAGASSRVMAAIQNAATRTGVDFSYLVKKAAQESSFDTHAKASTSSAAGLFQFTAQTWLQMVKNNGGDYGLGQYAAQIKSDGGGHLSVADGAARKEILNLRNDPTVSAEMAGELDKQNAAALKANVGGRVGGTELYLAHFLGAGGASSFLNEMHADPQTKAADVLPEAAAANPAVFYSRSGEARTLGDIYHHFARTFDKTGSAVQMAAAAPKAAPVIEGVAGMNIASAASASAANLAALSGVASAGAAGTPSIGAASGSAMPAGVAAVRATTAQIAAGGASTLFTAMMLGQMGGSGDAETAALSALSRNDPRKAA